MGGEGLGGFGRRPFWRVWTRFNRVWEGRVWEGRVWEGRVWEGRVWEGRREEGRGEEGRGWPGTHFLEVVDGAVLLHQRRHHVNALVNALPARGLAAQNGAVLRRGRGGGARVQGRMRLARRKVSGGGKV
jgi:hypothetical protein